MPAILSFILFILPPLMLLFVDGHRNE